MPKCTATGCANVGRYHFPTNPQIREQWTKALNRKNFTPSKHSRLCLDHFVPSDFRPAPEHGAYMRTRYCLKKEAVPSKFIFLENENLKPGKFIHY